MKADETLGHHPVAIGTDPGEVDLGVGARLRLFGSPLQPPINSCRRTSGVIWWCCWVFKSCRVENETTTKRFMVRQAMPAPSPEISLNTCGYRETLHKPKGLPSFDHSERLHNRIGPERTLQSHASPSEKSMYLPDYARPGTALVQRKPGKHLEGKSY